MRILLVDDSVKHRRGGKRQLEAIGHEVVVLCAYGEARELASKEAFDVALLDLLMPAEPTTLGSEALKEHLGREIAVGFPLSLELTRRIKMVAVATDSNHHSHPMSAVVDWFDHAGPLTVNGAKVLIMHAPMHDDGIKDWGTVLAKLTAKEE